ncbi:unnamed protein product [Caenorhabditis bovis]|uniref:Chondroitin proteoglycan 4 domain-containing protein n=1 Tax=Caenorhabditis bovis TaxID=2654633 RepID=A0A8S1EY07_9PELO|nr:unnamed protein product [Caenorhabditis bovis]
MFRLLLILLVISTCNSQLTNINEESMDFLTSMLEAFQGKNRVNLTQFMYSFEMPACVRRCMPDVGNLDVVFRTKESEQAMKNICANMKNSTRCAKISGCSHMFTDVMTNAFKFICIENIDKMSEQLECIQMATDDLHQDCENECAVQASFINKASHNKPKEILSMENMCNSTTCLARCYHDNLSERCSMGENFLDSILSTVSLNGERYDFDKILNIVMPADCKDHTFKLKIPEKISIDVSKPKSVGKPRDGKLLDSLIDDDEEASGLVEENLNSINEQNSLNTTLLVNGKLQFLQCHLTDTDGNSIEMEDFEELAKLLITVQPAQLVQKWTGPTYSIPIDVAAEFSNIPNFPWDPKGTNNKPTTRYEKSLWETFGPKVMFSKINYGNISSIAKSDGSMTDLSDASIGFYSDENSTEQECRERRNMVKNTKRERRMLAIFKKRNCSV